jgi:hypothetical protein
VASAATNTSRELGGVFGIALLGAIVTAAFNRGFLARLVEAGVPKGQAAGIVARAGASAAAGNTAADGTNSTIGQAVQHAFVHSIHVGLLVAIGFLLLASLVSALFVRSHVEREQPVSPDGQLQAREGVRVGH